MILTVDDALNELINLEYQICLIEGITPADEIYIISICPLPFSIKMNLTKEMIEIESIELELIFQIKNEIYKLLKRYNMKINSIAYFFTIYSKQVLVRSFVNDLLVYSFRSERYEDSWHEIHLSYEINMTNVGKIDYAEFVENFETFLILVQGTKDASKIIFLQPHPKNILRMKKMEMFYND